MSRGSVRLLVTCVSLFALVGGARAHLELLEPVSRHGGDVLKDGPCGRADSARTDNVSTFAPGETIVLRWNEYVDHPGHFRVALDADGDDAFVDPPCIAHCDTKSDPEPPVFGPVTTAPDMIVLAEVVADTDGGETTLTITLPDLTCERCTLQVIQVMYDKRPITVGGNDVYYQCADLVLRASVSPEPGAEPEPGTEPGPEPHAEVSTEVGETVGTSSDGCRTGPSSWWLGVLVLAWLRSASGLRGAR